MKAVYINPFLKGTINVLKTMASLEPIPGKPYLKKDKKSPGDISGIIGLSLLEDKKSTGDISGIIGFTGAKQGSVVVSFTKECALKVVSSMMKQEYTELNDEVRDAVGEITNMISGDARRHLADINLKFEAGIPTVITGNGHEISHTSNGPCIVIPFKCDGLAFFVEASFES